MTVAQLLTASRAAHQEYRQHAGRVNRDGKVSHPYREDHCLTAIRTALDTRQQAHALDPEHADPEWQADKVPHEDLVKFYETFLS